jgi:hypothetical protein
MDITITGNEIIEFNLEEQPSGELYFVVYLGELVVRVIKQTNGSIILENQTAKIYYDYYDLIQRKNELMSVGANPEFRYRLFAKRENNIEYLSEGGITIN